MPDLKITGSCSLASLLMGPPPTDRGPGYRTHPPAEAGQEYLPTFYPRLT